MVKADYSAVFPSPAREMDFRRAVAAVSFAVRSLLEIGLFAVVPFGLCRSPICLAAAAAAAAAAVVVDLSAAGLSAPVAAGFGSVGSAVFAADLACPVCFACSAFSVGVALGKGTVVA